MVEASWLDTHFQASRKEYEQILFAAGIQPGWRVLDAGAGSGSYLPLLGGIVGGDGGIVALDFAAENVAAMEQRLDEASLGCPVEVVQGSVLALPFEDARFDAVWCANTFQYFEQSELDGILAEFRRVLRPGGRLAVKEFDNVGLHFGPFDPGLRWQVLQALRGSPLMLGAGSLHTVDLPARLRASGFGEVRFRSFTGDFQHPLSPVQREFLASALELYASLAEQVEMPDDARAEWRAKVGDPASDLYLLNSPDFYFREVHGLATGLAPA